MEDFDPSTLNIKDFPKELYQSLVDLAKSNHRSLSQEVIYLLEKAVKASDSKKPSLLELQGLGKKYWKNVPKHTAQERDTWNKKKES